MTTRIKGGTIGTTENGLDKEIITQGRPTQTCRIGGCMYEHATQSCHGRHVPTIQISRKGGGAVKHEFHAGDTRDIPHANVFVKIELIAKQAIHIRDHRNVPGINGSVRHEDSITIVGIGRGP